MSRSSLPGTEARALLDALHAAERLKNELRHSWTSIRRPESVAEHCWRATLMAVFLAPYLDPGVNLGRVLELLVVHDLCEIYAGDVPLFDSLTCLKEKEHAEGLAMERLCAQLPAEPAARLWTAWQEYCAGTSTEARVAHVLDKLEAQLQHNEAPLDTWIDWEKAHVFNGLAGLGATDPAIGALCQAVISEAIEKLVAGGENLDRFGRKMSIGRDAHTWPS